MRTTRPVIRTRDRSIAHTQLAKMTPQQQRPHPEKGKKGELVFHKHSRSEGRTGSSRSRTTAKQKTASASYQWIFLEGATVVTSR